MARHGLASALSLSCRSLGLIEVGLNVMNY